MIARTRYSLLHLQMGQEVIYLILTVAVAASLVMLAYVVFQSGQLTDLRREVQGLSTMRGELAAKEQRAQALQQELGRAREAIDRMGADAKALEEALREKAELEHQVVDLNGQVVALQAQLDEARKVSPAATEEKPPILTLSEARGYFFRFGSAELDEDFRRRLVDDVIPILLREGPRYRVDVIEVIGHTDEAPVAQVTGNLDLQLLPYLRGDATGVPPRGADNVGLGMARAAAVARVLIADGRLHGYVVLPLSAGQAIDVDGTLALGNKMHDERERRRIEIRMRRRA